MKRVAALLLIIAVLAGCVDGGGEGQRTQVYFAVAQGQSQVHQVLDSEIITLDKDREYEGQVLEALAQAPKTEGLISPFAEGITIESWTTEDRAVTVELSEDFIEEPGRSQSMILGAIVLSLCSLDQVDSVSIQAGGKVYAAGLTEGDILLYDKETDIHSRQTTLYFADANVDILVRDTCILPVGEQEEKIYQLVIEELMESGGRDGLRSLIPEASALLEISVEDGVCTLDLNAAFYEDAPDTAAEERLVIYSIVNSLTGLPGIDSVKFLREGEQVDRYLYIPLDRPVERNESVVLSGDKTTVYVYLWSDAAESLVELPIALQVQDEAQIHQVVRAAVDYVGELGYDNPVYDFATLLSARNEGGGTCSVSFSNAAYDTGESERIADALVLAVTKLDVVMAVSIYLDGEHWPDSSKDTPVKREAISFIQ